MAAVKQYGWALEVASEDLQKDREIVMAAVQQSGNSLQLAIPVLRRKSTPQYPLEIPSMDVD